jgi:hypothetical protein
MFRCVVMLSTATAMVLDARNPEQLADPCLFQSFRLGLQNAAADFTPRRLSKS